MGLAKDKQVLKALSSRRFYPPLRNRVRARCPKWRSHLLNAEAPHAAIECDAKAAVAVVNQKSWWPSIQAQHSTICWDIHSAVGNDVTATCRISRLICRTTKNTYNVSNRMVGTQKKVARPYAGFVLLQELSPGRGRPATAARAHIFG